LYKIVFSGGNLGGAGAAAPLPSQKIAEFSEILTSNRAKNSLFECRWGRAFFKDFPVGGHFLKRDLSVR
jgi:hypothetical protein